VSIQVTNHMHISPQIEFIKLGRE